MLLVSQNPTSLEKWRTILPRPWSITDNTEETQTMFRQDWEVPLLISANTQKNKCPKGATYPYCSMPQMGVTSEV